MLFIELPQLHYVCGKSFILFYYFEYGRLQGLLKCADSSPNTNKSKNHIFVVPYFSFFLGGGEGGGRGSSSSTDQNPKWHTRTENPKEPKNHFFFFKLKILLKPLDKIGYS